MASQDFARTLGTGGESGFAHSQRWFAQLHLDLPLLLLLLLLASAGLFVLYSGSSADFAMVKKQAVHFAIGFTLLFICAQLPPRFYQSISPWLYLLSMAALAAVLLFGTGAKGAQRWLAIPGLPRFQPSEIMKLALPLAVAWYAARGHIPPKFTELIKAGMIIIFPTLFILKQPDLGTAILIMATGLSVVFFAGLSMKLIFGFAALTAAIMPMMWFFVMRDYQKRRVLTFLNPENDPLGSGWNIIQSKTAIGSGGLQGKGWLMGTQSHLEFLPESHTDFIIAVLAEEFGFIGVLALVTLYFLILMRCLYLAAHAETLYARLVSAGLVVAFFIYVFVNIGMVSGILPVVGVPLPLISYGGTSVISLLIAFGILMSMCIHKKN